MMDLKEKLTRPVGPLPAWGWVVVFVGGFLAYRLLKGRGGSGVGGGIAAIPGDITRGIGSNTGGGVSSNNPPSSSNPPSSGGRDPLPTTPWNDLWDSNHSLIPADWVAWLRRNASDYLSSPPSTNTVDGGGGGGGGSGSGGGGVFGGRGLSLPPNLDPTSPEFKAFFNIPANIQTVGDLVFPAGITAAQKADALSRNMTLVDWYKYQITKTQAALNGQVLGESTDFTAFHNPLDYYVNTLQSGNFYMFSPTDPRDIAAKAQALTELGLNAVPTTGSALPIGHSTITSPPSTTSGNSARISVLQAAIAQDNIYIANLTKAGKTGTPAYATDYATLVKNKQELASLTLPVGTTSGY